MGCQVISGKAPLLPRRLDSAAATARRASGHNLGNSGADDLRTLPDCPQPGQGDIRHWLILAAKTCRRAGLSEAATAVELNARISRPPEPPNEIQIATASVYLGFADSQHSTNGEAAQTPVKRINERLSLSQREAANLLNCSVATLWRLRQRGLIRPSLITRNPRYLLSDLKALLEEGR